MAVQALKKVFKKPTYILLALITGSVVFVLAVWLPNISLIVRIMGHSGISLKQKLDFPVSLLGGIATNFTLLSASYTILIAILFGINIAMAAYFLRHRIKKARNSATATGLLGAISGVLGIGCAACGTFLLTSIFSLFGASTILTFLPLNGGEFGILGVILLLVSIYLTAKQVQNPAMCKVK